MATDRLIVFNNSALVPTEWLLRAGQGPVWAFNPAIVTDGADGWIFAYRLVFRDEVRRIAICRLDSHFHVIPGSCVPLSDVLNPQRSDEYSEVDRTWYADPRLYCLGERLLLYWNSGWHNSPNAQFLQEIDQLTLLPVGKPRVVRRNRTRQFIEKNWMFFGADALWAVYSIAGQRILKSSFESSESIEFEEVFDTDWNANPYVHEFGSLRGGAPPQLLDGGYYAFCHSVSPSPAGYRYVAGIYRFGAEPPFAPTHSPIRPVPLRNPFGVSTFYPRLNSAVGEVLYPSGAQFHHGEWVISYGINDERCAISLISHSEIQACFARVT